MPVRPHVSPEVRSAVADYFRLLAEQGVRVLYAVESGSRAWGFASPDSDYDVRFLYVRDANWYVSVQKRRDVIEAALDPELDFAGWDLLKALPLLQKSNPSLFEWLGSPIVYAQDVEFISEFRELADRCMSGSALFKHYVNMGTANWGDYFKGDSVRLKKYLYVLRPVFCCRWLERFGSTPPVVFSELLEAVGELGSVGDELQRLLVRKSETSELGEAARLPILDGFIESELSRFAGLKMESSSSASYDELDIFFRHVLRAFGPSLGAEVGQ